MSQEQECQMPQPTKEHAKVLEGVGTWDVKAKHFMEPGKPPVEATAVEKVMAVGGFWTVSRYESTLFGQPFIGQSTMGYNPEKGVYVLTWIDSMSHFLFHFEGNFDASGKTLTMTAKGPSMMGPGLTDWRSVMEGKDKDHMVFKMFMKTPMGECQLMENQYTRRK